MQLQGCLLLLVSIGAVRVRGSTITTQSGVRRALDASESAGTDSPSSAMIKKGTTSSVPNPLRKRVRFDLPPLTTEEEVPPTSTERQRLDQSKAGTNSDRTLVSETSVTKNHSGTDFDLRRFASQFSFFESATRVFSRQQSSPHRSGSNRGHARKPHASDVVTDPFRQRTGNPPKTAPRPPSPTTPPTTKPIVQKERLVTSRMVIYTMAVLLTIIVMGTCIYMVLVAFAL